MNCSAPLSIHFAKQDVKNEFFEKGWAEGGTKRCIRGFYPPLPKKNVKHLIVLRDSIYKFPKIHQIKVFHLINSPPN